ncbi:MAG: hypothetical protein ACK501_04945 [Planctomycetota bacterium]
MDLVYRALGLAASFAFATARRSINFVPFLALVMFGFGALAVYASNEVRYSLANGAEAKVSTVAETRRLDDAEGHFVSLQGELIAEPVFEYTETRRGSRSTKTKASYFALLDADGKTALLVQTQGTTRPAVTPDAAGLLGMLMPMKSDLQRELDRASGSFGEVSFDRRFVLEFGRRPGSVALWSSLAAFGSLTLLALLTAWSRRYVIFRGDADAVVAPTAAPPVDEAIFVHASGLFTLGGVSKRFPWIPAGLVAADGRIVACANIDASSHFMGFKTNDRAGMWTIDLASDGLPQFEIGYQYYGRRRLPAVRVFHSEGGKSRTTVLACEDENVRAMVVARLGKQPPPPMASSESAPPPLPPQS